MTRAFLNAYDNLIGHEGGYSNNSNDIGGETYKGISRRYNDGWPGWKIIDSAKPYNFNPKDKTQKRALNEKLSNIDELQTLVKEFYYQKYWNKFKGDDLPYDVAEELLEQSVILGTWKTAGKNLQEALNLLNRNGKLFPDLVIDGIVGKKTLQAVNLVNKRRLLNVLNGIEFCKFKESMENRPANELFVGWFNRLNFAIGAED